MRGRDRAVLCAVLIGIIIGPIAMAYLALAAHGRPVERPAKTQPVIIVRRV